MNQTDMARKSGYVRKQPSSRQNESRKRYLAAVIITCIVAVMVLGSLHVMSLGSERLVQMRNKAGYDVADVKKHIRAAGEDLNIHGRNEYDTGISTYIPGEAQALLSTEQWIEFSTMETIPAGSFKMGTDRFRADDQDKPMHQVTTAAYRMDKYPVTNAQYARFVAQSGHRPPSAWPKGHIPQGEVLNPVTLVSWYDAISYCTWAGKHLPTEIEWEKAARGTDGRRWPWGNMMDAAYLNTYYSVGHAGRVDQYPQGASPYGAMDMAGNVYEWVADDFAPYTGSRADTDLFKVKVPKVLSAQDRSKKTVDLVIDDELRYKVLRGGSWNSDPFSTTTYHRNYESPNKASDFIGFRCVADMDFKEGK